MNFGGSRICGKLLTTKIVSHRIFQGIKKQPGRVENEKVD
jgi:hypothetical protein